MRLAGARQPVRRRAGAVGEAGDGPRARRDDPLRRAPRRRQSEGAARAVPAVLGAAPARDARLRRRHRRPARVPHGGRRRRREHVVLTGDYASWVGSLGAERAPARPDAPRADAALREARPRAGGRGGARADGGRHSGVTDSHAHLDACDEPAAALVERAAGSRRHANRHDRHRHRVEPGGARDRRAARRRASPRSGSTRIRPATPEAERLDELRELLGSSEGGRGGGDRARHRPPLRDTGASSGASSTRSSRSPTSSASRSSSTIARRTTRRPLRSLRSPARWSSTASRRPALVTTAVERGYYVSFAGNVTYPKAVALREAAQRSSGGPDPRRDRQPVPRAAAGTRRAERARATSCTRSRVAR